MQDLGERWDDRILEDGGRIPLMWWPDEPLFSNVTTRSPVSPSPSSASPAVAACRAVLAAVTAGGQIRMAIHRNLRQPDWADPSLLLREAAKNGEYLEIERLVRHP